MKRKKSSRPPVKQGLAKLVTFTVSERQRQLILGAVARVADPADCEWRVLLGILGQPDKPLGEGELVRVIDDRIASIGYDPGQRALFVICRHRGETYRHAPVDRATFLELVNAPPKRVGYTYWRDVVRKIPQGVRVDPGSPGLTNLEIRERSTLRP